MPPAKRSSTPAKSSSASKPAARKTTAKPAASKAASSGTKATGTTARKAAAKTATQAKGAATRTANAAASGAAKTRTAAKTPNRSTAKAAGSAVAGTAKAAKTGAKATATAAQGGAKATTTQAKAANTRTRKASGGAGVVATTVKETVRPRETAMLTRERIQSTLDDAAARGRITRKDANDLVAELMKHGRHTTDEVGELFGKSVKKISKTTKRVRKAEPVDRIVRGADRARRAAGVGPTFPIVGYDDLNVSQVQVRIKELSKPDARKVLTYERKNANRKSVVGALEKALA
jgi:polyhydroxyalkanoate synthesis regulator phasin